MAGAVRPARSVVRKEIGIAVNEAVSPQQADLEAAINHLRRVIQDDMDATNESTAVFGRLLSQLADRLEAIESQVQELAGSVEALVANPAPGRSAGANGP